MIFSIVVSKRPPEIFTTETQSFLILRALALQRRFTLQRRFEYYNDVLRRARFAGCCLA